MPRIARVVVPGIPHHVTQRGNRRERVFFHEDDRQLYLQILLKYANRHQLAVFAYTLMTNHVHLVCVPPQRTTLHAVMMPVNLRYAQHVNRSQHISGRLWQGRFFSCPLDQDHFWAATRYVEQNPIRAGMVRRAEDYPWSSATAHCGLHRDPLLHPLPPGGPTTPEEWSDWLVEGPDERMLERLRRSTHTGRPAGGKEFVADLEARLGRTLSARTIGRPRRIGETARPGK